MGKSKRNKRSRSRSSSSSEFESNKKLAKRLKKLEKELLRRHSGLSSRSRSRHVSRQRSPSRSYSRSRTHRPRARSMSADSTRLDRAHSSDVDLPLGVENPYPQETRSDACSIVLEKNMDACSVAINDIEADDLVIHNDVSLPEDVLEILGEDPEKTSTNAIALHDQLVVRWNSVLQNGLKRDDLVDILNKFTIPTNLSNLAPPKLNSEISAALQKHNLSIDSSQSEVQNQLGKGICALGKGITDILNNIDKVPADFKNNVLSNLLDSGRILTNLFHRISHTRKNLIIPHVKNLKVVADKCIPSEYLFGADLMDKLKSLKTIETVSKDLKITANRPKVSLYKGQNRGGGGGGAQPRNYNPNHPSTSFSRPLNSLRPVRRSRDTGPVRSQTSRNYHWESIKDSQWRNGEKRKQRD